MKKSLLIFAMVGLFAAIYATTFDELWKNVKQNEAAFPRTAENIVDSIYSEAEKQNDEQQQLKALIYKAKLNYAVSDDELYSDLNELQTFAAKCKNEAVKAIYYSYIAMYYKGLLNQNRHLLPEYSTLAEEESESPLFWSPQMYEDSIRLYMNKAVKTIEPKKNLNAGQYADLVEMGADSILRPTLYNVILHKAIAMADDNDSVYVRSLYDLLVKSAQNYEEKALSVLEKDIYEGADIDNVIYEYFDRDIVVYAFYQKALKLPAAEAYELCKNVELTYKGNKYLPFVSSYRSRLEQPYISAKAKAVVYPGEKCAMHLEYRNLSYIGIKLYKLNADREYLAKNKNRIIPDSILSPAVSYSYVLNNKDKVSMHDTTVYFAVPEDGYYKYEVRLSEGEGRVMQMGRISASKLMLLSQSRNEVLYCTVADRKSGKFVSGVSVELYDRNGEKLSATTDKYGEASFSGLLTSKTYTAFLSKKDDVYYPYESVSINRHNDVKQYVRKITVLLDRKVYEPGQTIYYKAIFSDEGLKLNDRRVLEDFETDIVISNPYNMDILRKNAVTNEFGSITGSFTLPKNTINGNYYIKIGGAYEFFYVQDYKRPTFEVKILDNAEFYSSADSVNIDFTTDGYNGEPLKNAIAVCEVTKKSIFFRHIVGRMYSTVIYRDTIKIDGKNKQQFAFLPKLTDDEMGAAYEVAVSVTSDLGETQTASKWFRIGQDAMTLQVSAPENVEKSSKGVFSIKAVNSEGVSSSVSVEYAVKKAGNTIISGTMLSGDSLSIAGIDALESGRYMLTATANNNGENCLDSTAFVLYGRDDKKVPVDTLLWMISDNEEIAQGDDLIFKIGSGKNVKVLCSLYGESGLIKREVLSINNKIKNYVISTKDIDSDVLKFEALTIYEEKYERAYKDIRITVPKQELKLNLSTFRDVVEPETSEEWTINASYADGTPAEAEILVSMYDLSLDKYAANDWKFILGRSIGDIFPYWRHQTYDIRNAVTIRDYLLLSYTFKFPQLNTFGFSLLSNGFGLRPLFRSAIANDAMLTSARMETLGTGAIEPPAEALSNDVSDLETYRESFAETAFFLPQLHTDSLGNAKFLFTTPADITSWKFMVAAHTKDMQTKILTDTIVSKKTVSVSQILPRFVREDDEVIFAAKAENLSETAEEFVVSWSVADYADGRVLAKKDSTLEIAAHSVVSLALPLKVERGVETLALQIKMSGKNHTDGERRYLKVLPVQADGVKTKRMQLGDPGEYSIDIAALLGSESETIQNRALILELSENPDWSALMALTYISEVNSDNCFDIAAAVFSNRMLLQLYNESENYRRFYRAAAEKNPLSAIPDNEDLSIVDVELTPWVQQGRTYSNVPYYLDRGRASALLAYYVDKLKELQLPDGSFPWFKNGRSNYAASVYVADLLNNTASFGDNYDKLSAYLQTLLNADMKNNVPVSERQLKLMLHCDNESEAYKHFYKIAVDSKTKFSETGKAMLARIAYRNSDFSVSEELIKSLVEYSQEREGAMYWKNVKSLSDYVQIMRAFAEINPKSKELESMIVYLLQNKETTMWNNAATTAMAAEIIIQDGSGLFSSDGEIQVPALFSRKLSDKGAMPGYSRYVLQGAEIEEAGKNIKLVKTGNKPAFVAAYMLFTDDLNKFADTKSKYLQLDKQLYLQEPDGRLRKIKNNDELKLGDKLIVRLTIKADREFDFVCVKDYVAAALEPVQQVSGRRYAGSTPYYMEVKDFCTNFYFDDIDKGTYVIDYEMYVSTAGKYLSTPAEIQCVYAPQYSSLSSSQSFNVVSNTKE